MLALPAVALCSFLAIQDPTPATPAARQAELDTGTSATATLDRVVAIELSAADSVLEGHGPCRWIDYVAEFSGTLHMWTKTDGVFDTFLRVEDGAGTLVDEDDDSGGTPTPYLLGKVEPGTELAIAVAASKPGEGGKVELHLVAARETETTRAEAQRSKQELTEIKALRLAGDLARARARVAALVEHLERVDGARESELLANEASYASTETDALGLLGPTDTAERMALTHLSRTLPPDHARLQQARGNFAGTLFALGDLPGSRALCEQVLEVLSRTLPADHSNLQLARLNLANTVFQVGDIAGARALYEKVLEVYTRTLPSDHPHLQLARGNLGNILNVSHDYSGARALFEQVIEVSSRTLPAGSEILLASRSGLANTLFEMGDLTAARALDEQTLEGLLRTLPSDHPEIQKMRSHLAYVMKDQGDFAGARAIEEAVLEFRTRVLPRDHPDLQRTRLNLALTLARARVIEGAGPEPGTSGEPATNELFARLADDYARSILRSAREALLSGSHREADERCANLSTGPISNALSFAEGLTAFEQSEELERLAFLCSEAARGASLGSARLARRASAHPRYGELHDGVRSASAELARLAQGGASADEFDRARSRRDAAERELLDLGKQTLGDESDAFDLTALSTKLLENHAVVGYRRYKRGRIDADGMDRYTRSLCAFVVRSSGRLHRIELGPIGPIEDAVRSWREAIGVRLERGFAAESTPVPESLLRGEELRRLVFDPLLPAITDVDRLVVALDDVMHLVPLDALPSSSGAAHSADDRDGAERAALVGDRWRVETRCTLTELLSAEDAPLGTVLVALGGASFNSEPLPLAAEDVSVLEEPSADPARAEASVRSGRWERGFEPLTYSGPEARGVAALYAEGFEDERPALVLEKRKASRGALEELAPRARFLHVATHGWFAPESIRSMLDPEPFDARGAAVRRMDAEERVKGMAPMLLCGLALAGANLPEDQLGRVPGLMTAEEISTLDLGNCELAVLSACNTNVGESRAGQGVASLQRALHMAGARSVITSLWKVPDEATAELMLDFYRRIWILNEPKHEALWEAKRKLRDAVDELGTPKYTTRDWAAWVLTGEP